MGDFTITLDNKEYKCTSNVYGKEGQNYNISVQHGKVNTTINIPIEEKITRAKVILFIEAFHVAMHNAFEAQNIDQNYVWNKKQTLV